jgi:hypothetical protein
VYSRTTVIIPFDFGVIFVRSLHCAECSARLAEVPQAFHTVSGSQFLIAGGGFGKPGSLGSVRIRSRSAM